MLFKVGAQLDACPYWVKKMSQNTVLMMIQSYGANKEKTCCIQKGGFLLVGVFRSLRHVKLEATCFLKIMTLFNELQTKLTEHFS